MSWALPLELDAGGAFPDHRPRPVAGTVRLVLGVAPGERRLLPGFGWEAHRFPDLDDPVRAQAAAVLAEDALRRWAPDLGVERVDIRAVRGKKVTLEVRARGASSQVEIEIARWAS
jgi:phage baseplate assembly protein W